METFQRYFCDPNEKKAQERIEVLLSCTMMRRTMRTAILNRPILNLPKPHPTIRYTRFSPQEKIIYRITEQRFRESMNTYFQKASGGKGYAFFMVQLLRLRQCTSHAFMLEQTIKECWTLDDVEELHHRLAQAAVLDQSRLFYEQTKIWVTKSDEQRQAEQALRDQNKEKDVTQVSGVTDEEGELLPFGRGTYGLDFDMKSAFDTLNMKDMIERVTCGVCYDYPNTAKRTDVSLLPI
jgi:hypothetical protein